MRPVIGLIPLYDDDKDSYWMLPGYMKVCEENGSLPIMLPLTDDKEELEEAYKLCDGILFTGGHDVDPIVYGEKKKETCGKSCTLRDEMEAYLLDRCIKDDKPFLGICRGIQFVNAHLGGTLYQDLPTEYASEVEHHMTPPYDKTAHEVKVLEDTHLSEIIGAGIHKVNSYHHQAVKDLGKGLVVMAISSDGLVEAVEVEGKRFAIGVQWHPEFSYKVRKESVQLIKAFVDACK